MLLSPVSKVGRQDAHGYRSALLLGLQRLLDRAWPARLTERSHSDADVVMHELDVRWKRWMPSALRDAQLLAMSDDRDRTCGCKSRPVFDQPHAPCLRFLRPWPVELPARGKRQPTWRELDQQPLMPPVDPPQPRFRLCTARDAAGAPSAQVLAVVRAEAVAVLAESGMSAQRSRGDQTQASATLASRSLDRD
jgi:hypothetical protein